MFAAFQQVTMSSSIRRDINPWQRLPALQAVTSVPGGRVRKTTGRLTSMNFVTSMRTNTKAIIINTPHNPTGYLMSRQDYDAVHKFAQENNLLLFSDEVYRESEYDPASRLPAACDYGEHAISLGVTSKTYGLAGLRIGWIATKNRKIYEKMAVPQRLHHDLQLCPE